MNMKLQLHVSAIAGAILAALLMSASQAAFIVEADSNGAVTGKANANFSSTGHSFSTTPSGAVGLDGDESVFGNPLAAPDVYTFSYTPGVDADNTIFTTGDVLGDTSAIDADGVGGAAPAYLPVPQLASGLAGGASGLYKVYLTVPATTNSNAAGSLIDITSDLPTISLDPVNLNTGGTAPVGGGNGATDAWLHIATVPLTAGNTYSVSLTANAATFVSQRAHGVMWEAVIPEPSTCLLTGLACIGLLAARRRVA